MKEINEVIVKIAKKKAEAALEAAEKVVLNGITFAEGIQPGEVEIESGIEELSETLGGSFAEGYVDCHGDLAYRLRWFIFGQVHFFESSLIRANELPEGVKVVESREELYNSEL